MSVFHQMGHDSINLVKEKNLAMFSGIVCSPLNYSEDKLRGHITSLPEGFQSMLDPQLYFPNCKRKRLREWKYFPKDFDTADSMNLSWWKDINQAVIDTCIRVGATHVCSPCIVPAKFSNDYYKHYVDVGNDLHNLAQQNDKGFYQTAIIDFNAIKEHEEAETIASILSQTNGDAIYLIIKTDVVPRRELSDSESLLGVMKLIRLLVDADITVFVGFSSSEILLWKYAGAEMFATGKYFNLRRFTIARFDEPSGGGGQLPYWFEKNLIAFLREGDLVRLQNEDMLHPDHFNNPFSVEILKKFETSPGTPWLGLSWRDYLYSFAELEASLDRNKIKQLLIDAEKNWREAEDRTVFMEEARNDGSWIRLWRIAISSFDKEFN